MIKCKKCRYGGGAGRRDRPCDQQNGGSAMKFIKSRRKVEPKAGWISVEDALLFASMLMTMVRNADIVRIGCQSLIANISSCIMTRRGGEVWKQTIYYPFRLLARHARGTVLEVAGSPACYATPAGARVPEVDVPAVWNRAQGEVAEAPRRAARPSP